MPPIAPLIKASLRLPPAASVVAPAAIPPAKAVLRPKPAGPRTAPNATVRTIRPTVEEAIFLIGAVTALNNFFKKNSGKPVAGLMVPEPPMRLSN